MGTRSTRQWPQIKQWLRIKGFNIGNTQTGWCAVNRTGIVIIVSATRVKIEWQGSEDDIRVRKTDEMSMQWTQKTISQAERDIEICADEAQSRIQEWRTTDGE